MTNHHNIDETFFLPEQQFFVQTLTYINTVYHEHSFFEIFYVLSGNVIHVVNDRKEQLVAGDIVFLRPGDLHKFVKSNSDDFVHTDVLIKSNLFNQVIDTLNSPTLRSFLFAKEPCKLHLSQHEISYLEQEIRTIEKTPKIEAQSLIFSFTCNLTCLIIKKMFSSTNDAIPLWLKQLLATLSFGGESNLSPEFIHDTINSLAYNKSYVSRAFKKYMNCTLTEYVNDLRFSMAYSLIRSTDRTINDIIAAIGISNKTYFYKGFIKRYNTTPASIRQNVKKIN